MRVYEWRWGGVLLRGNGLLGVMYGWGGRCGGEELTVLDNLLNSTMTRLRGLQFSPFKYVCSTQGTVRLVLA